MLRTCGCREVKNGCISHMDLPHFDPVKKLEGIGRESV
jgi:hypothetical protein